MQIGDLEEDEDSDFWVDWWEQKHGPIDSPQNRKEYPEGFAWTCCQRHRNEKGCKLGRHQSNPDLSKKGRYEGTGAEVEEDGDEDEEEEDDHSDY